MKKSMPGLSMLLVITAAFFVQTPARMFAGTAEDVQRAMQLLKSKATALGAPSVRGRTSRRQDGPCFILWHDPINNDFTVVDEVKKEKGGTATFFVKSGDEFVRVSTNVQKADGSRALGTLLDPKGKVIEAIAQDKSYFGEVNILGKDYVTGYEPIHNASNNIIGIYYVGYLK